MKITSLTLWKVPLTSHETYYMASGKTCATVPSIVLRVGTDSGSSVRHLRAISGSGGSILAEGRLELGKALHGGLFSDPVVLGDYNFLFVAFLVHNLCLDRDNFA